NQRRTQQLNEQLRSLQRQSPSQVTRARIDLLQAELDYLTADSELMRQRLAGNSALQDLASQQKNLLNLQIRRIEDEIRLLQSVVNEKR
ncbi:hypothetical protein R0J93_24255, partial [Pseudoalteromonas sp. SIMBA_148]